jgi:hypothetical protein
MQQVRTEVAGIKRRLERGLAALTGAASGDRTFTAAHLDEFLEPVLPLLGSPLVGEGAGFEAVHALAQVCLLPHHCFCGLLACFHMLADEGC